jgi:uncharacterized protein (UPF0332 family)
LPALTGILPPGTRIWRPQTHAMFYTAEALLANRDLTFSSHGSMHGAFGKEFAKTEELDPKFHRWLIDAFRQRQDLLYRS